jgi:hypothetical protein
MSGKTSKGGAANPMRVSIVLTTDDGNTFHGEAELSSHKKPKSAALKTKSASEKSPHVGAGVNLSSPVRPFMKRHARHLGGPQKLTLLLAHITKGDTKKEIVVADIQKQWGKMKGILGVWNAAYATRAKDQEWIDSPKYGTYSLLSGWKGALNG